MLGVRSLFRDVGGAITVWGVGVRSLLGCGSAIAFGDVAVRSQFWECGSAIAFGDVGSAIAFGMWECDRFWDVGVRSLFGGWCN
jgi:hypothetical protein